MSRTFLKGMVFAAVLAGVGASGCATEPDTEDGEESASTSEDALLAGNCYATAEPPARGPSPPSMAGYYPIYPKLVGACPPGKSLVVKLRLDTKYGYDDHAERVVTIRGPRHYYYGGTAALEVSMYPRPYYSVVTYDGKRISLRGDWYERGDGGPYLSGVPCNVDSECSSGCCRPGLMTNYCSSPRWCD